MFATSSPILQYTPPTCTLEIWFRSTLFFAKNKQKKLEKISFELRFDDPRLPDEKQVTIKGDRSQLEALCDVVHSYVQYLIRQRATSINLVESEASPTPKTTEEGQDSSLPSFKTQSLFVHELSLGELSKGTSVKTVKLSATQLFDLANALENYQDEIESLAVLKPRNNPQQLIFWGGIAATVLLAIGLNTGWIKVFPQFPELAEKETNSQENSSPVPGADVQNPPPPPPINIPTPTVPLALRNIQRLPPPPPVEPPGVGTYNNGKNSPNAGRITIKPSAKQPSFPTDNNSKGKMTIALRTPSNLTPNIPPPPPLKPSPSSSVKVEPLATLPAPNSPEARQKNSSVPSLSNSAADGGDSNFAPESAPTSSVTKKSDLPQLLEVKSYFKQRWQPKENLQQSLEYRLSIDANGSLNRIIPIGQASKIHLDSTGMPLLGESFVSPLTNQDTATIRLVLNPDGTVQTFAE
jgi:hypothetical protein